MLSHCFSGSHNAGEEDTCRRQAAAGYCKGGTILGASQAPTGYPAGLATARLQPDATVPAACQLTTPIAPSQPLRNPGGGGGHAPACIWIRKLDDYAATRGI